MKLTVLGSGSAVQFQNRASSCYLIEFGNEKLLVDAGFWVLDRLEKISVRADEIDYIYISHKHPDHFFGLIHLLFALKNPFYNRKKPIVLFGFDGLKEYIKEFKGILGKWIEPDIELAFVEKTYGEFSNFAYKLFKTEHSKESVGVELLIENKKIAYTGDTEYFPGLAKLVDNSEIAVLECGSSESNNLKGHLNIARILSFCSGINVRHIILSHFYPDSLPVEELPPNFFVAQDLFCIEI